MKTALVTGGATGLGREVAVKLAQRGVAVSLADLSEAGLRGTVEQIAADLRASITRSRWTSPLPVRLKM